MANYYSDINEIKFELENSPLMQRIVELKELGYADKDTHDYAPQDFADAMDSYDRLLDICLLYTSPSPRDRTRSRMPSSA